MEVKYQFRRDDDGKLVDVDFETMMEAKDGFLTLPDGVTARRVNRPPARKTAKEKGSVEIVSDALGFTEHQLGDFEKDRRDNGFRGVEFVRDPTEPTFFRVKCSSPQVWSRYVKHRGMFDKNNNNGSGAMLSESQIAKTRKMLERESRN